MKPKSSPFKAWLKSLPLALGVPAIVYFISIAIIALNTPGAFVIQELGAIVEIATVVHFLAYLVTGLPIFLSQFGKADSPVWRPRIGVPLGAVLGMVMLGILTGLLSGDWVFDQPSFYLTGAGYGVATALAALRQRPKRG